MRIVIDLQGAQGSNRNRGIGRYSLSIAKAIVHNKGNHEVSLVLNGQFPESVKAIRSDFNGHLPQENIYLWHAHDNISSLNHNNWYRETAELIRETLIESLMPDVVLLTSLFEGLADNTATSIHKLSNTIPTATILYDLIPLIHRKHYLQNTDVASWYETKLNHIRRSDMLLAISESSRNESMDFLGFPDTTSINISTACDSHFQPIKINHNQERELYSKYDIQASFIMYTGGIDYRKNIEGLIQAYANLSKSLREEHQLVIVCAIQEKERENITHLVKKYNLARNDIIFTGFVTESDLTTLYNLCKVFIFPSWHEGFGLPILEAMSCGKAVIGSNTSSIPEVIGYEDALFDPGHNESITKKLTQVLTDDVFRMELEQHSLKRAKRFSWDKSAGAAITALERLHTLHKQQSALFQCPARRPKLAYVSPLPPERSGISDYSAELLPELARHYDIDVIVDQEVLSNTWINVNCQIRDIGWLQSHAKDYDRVLYHFGNSHFHQHMFDLLEKIPGVVVLHDFFLSGIIAHMEFTCATLKGWTVALYNSHGYKAVSERFHEKELSDVIWRYPCNFQILNDALGVIVHSENSKHLAHQWYATNKAKYWSHIPLLRMPALGKNRSESRKTLKLNEDDFIICSFGLLGPTKLNLKLLDAWLASDLSKDNKCKLIFVGQNDDGEYGKKLLRKIKKSHYSERIDITGWTDNETYQHYLTASDINVQLRTKSRGETSASILDSMNYGIATIINANGSMSDLPDNIVCKLPDIFENTQLTASLEKLWHDNQYRKTLGKNAKLEIQKNHAPRKCADQYFSAIENYYRHSTAGIHSLTRAIAKIENMPDDKSLLQSLSNCITRSIPQKYTQKQIFVDISELLQRDSKSGIQRVVRSVLLELLSNPPRNIRIEPVYATTFHGYRYARKFTLDFLNCPNNFLLDDPIELNPGDIFLGLDLQPQIITAHQRFFQKIRQHGIKVLFVVYDLLCTLMPQHFVKGGADGHKKWLEVVTESDGAICISNAVAAELEDWIEVHYQKRPQHLKISSFHLGADIKNSIPTNGTPKGADNILKKIRSRKSFLMVGTIEPRKNHLQTISAFEQLWAEGVDINLVIVGKMGWMVDKLINMLKSHGELDERLFWLDGISDEYLEKVYASSTCLIAASEGEGFGLPLIEAAQHELAIIARDIPVFREVAGNLAYYFTGDTPADMAVAIQDWLQLFHSNQHPKSTDIPYLTWEKSTANLLSIIINQEISYEKYHS